MQPQVERSRADITTARNAVVAPRRNRRQGGRGWSYTLTSWLGLVPFLLFCLLFEIIPAIIIIQGSFTDDITGAATLDNYKHMFSQVSNLHAFETSISLSLVTALLGGLIGGFAAYGVYNLRTGWLRNFLVGFSSIAANFAGVPLAFAFVATLGVEGFITILIHNLFHVDLYNLGFSLYTFWGLVIGYVFSIATHDPGYTSSAERFYARAGGGRHQSGRFEFYLLAASRASHLATLAHCSHNVTFCQLIRSLCHRLRARWRRHQPRDYPHQFRCERQRYR